jgi:hypothetical protein
MPQLFSFLLINSRLKSYASGNIMSDKQQEERGGETMTTGGRVRKQERGERRREEVQFLLFLNQER